jgi:hypothetical protein
MTESIVYGVFGAIGSSVAAYIGGRSANAGAEATKAITGK